MTKEQYIHLKQTNPMGLLHARYKEKFDSSKHKQFLEEHTMLMFLQMWGNPNVILQNVVKEYDKEFEL
jgi:hypothetical protein